MYLELKYGWDAKENAFCHGDELDKNIATTLGEFGFFLVSKTDDLEAGERHMRFETEETVTRPNG